MQFSVLLLPALAALAAAESTVIEYFAATKTVPGLSVSYSSYSSIAGTVLGTNAAGTTYKIACMSGAPKSDCSIDQPFTMFAGPDTLSYSKTLTAEIEGYTGIVGEDVQCSFTHSTESAVCTFNMDVTVSVDGITTSTMTTTTISYPEKSVVYDKLTVVGTATGVSVASGTGASSTDAAAGLHNVQATAVPLAAAAAIAVAALF
jgi:hypothetical protein